MLKLARIKKRFSKLKRKIHKNNKGQNNENTKYNETIFYYYELILDNIKKKHFDIAMVISCIIIESIAAKRKYECFIPFSQWLTKTGKLTQFFNLIKNANEEVFKGLIETYENEYKETYGPRKNFISIIVESFNKLDCIPAYIPRWDTKKTNGTHISTPRAGDISKEETYKILKEDAGIIYDEYRSPFVHQGKPINAFARIQSTIGGISMPGAISVQDIALMALIVMEVNLS